MTYILHIIFSQGVVLTLFIYSVAVFFAFVENVYPQAHYPVQLTTRKSRIRRWARNVEFYLINSALLSPLYEAIPLLIIAHLSVHYTFSNNPFYIIFAILILDLALYVAHWLNHHIPIFWAFHRVHHMDEFLDASSGFRFHMFEISQTILVRSILIAVLGINPKTILIYVFISAFVLIYEHSNVRLNSNLEKLINLVFVTPRMHWIHHNRTLPETNTNYSVIFSFWDRIFNTLSTTARSNKVVVGLAEIPDQPIVKLVFFPFISLRCKRHRHSK